MASKKKNHPTEGQVCKALGWSTTDVGKLARFLEKVANRWLEIFFRDIKDSKDWSKTGSRGPSAESIIDTCVGVVSRGEVEYSNCTEPQHKLDAKWKVKHHYIWFITTMVTNCRAPGGKWAGTSRNDIRKQCNVALMLLVRTKSSELVCRLY